MVDALKRASAKRITVVMPFFPYARQDKKGRGREPISARLVADLFQVAGADRMMAVDLHTAQIQGFFDGPVDHLFALPLLSSYVKRRIDHSRGHDRVARRRPGAARRALVRDDVRRAAGVHPQDPRPATSPTRPRPTGSSVTSTAASASCSRRHDRHRRHHHQGGRRAVRRRCCGRHRRRDARDLLRARRRPPEELRGQRGGRHGHAAHPRRRALRQAHRAADRPLLARAVREVFDDGSVTSLFDGHA